MSQPAYRIAESPSLPGQTEIDRNLARFFVQFGFDVILTDTQAVQYHNENGDPVYFTVPRGRIVPCVNYQKKAHIATIPEAKKIPGTEEEDRHGNVIYVKEWGYAGDEAQRLMDFERSGKRKDGLVLLNSINGYNAVLYGERGSINSLFFPDGFDSYNPETRAWIRRQPQTNKEMIAHLNQRRELLKGSNGPDIPLKYRDAILALADELVAAAELAHNIQVSRLERAHTCMKLSPSDEAFKDAYDSVDEEMLLRTGVPRVHAADVQTATALEMLAGNSSNSDQAILQLVANQQEQMAMMREQMAQTNALLQAFMAQMTGTAQPETKKKA